MDWVYCINKLLKIDEFHFLTIIRERNIVHHVRQVSPVRHQTKLQVRVPPEHILWKVKLPVTIVQRDTCVRVNHTLRSNVVLDRQQMVYRIKLIVPTVRLGMLVQHKRKYKWWQFEWILNKLVDNTGDNTVWKIIVFSDLLLIILSVVVQLLFSWNSLYSNFWGIVSTYM